MPRYFVNSSALGNISMRDHFGIWGSDSISNDSTPDVTPTIRWSTINRGSLLGDLNVRYPSTAITAFGDPAWQSNGPFYKINIASDKSNGYKGRVSITSPISNPVISYYLRIPWIAGGPFSSFTVTATPLYGNNFNGWYINSVSGSPISINTTLTVANTSSIISTIGNNTLIAAFNGTVTEPVDAIALCTGSTPCTLTANSSWFFPNIVYPNIGQNFNNSTQFWSNTARNTPATSTGWYSSPDDPNIRIQMGGPGVGLLQRVDRRTFCTG